MRYSYRCNDCELIFDVEEPMEADHVAAPCPTCKQPCDRVWTTPVIMFRGPDFTLGSQAEEVPEPDPTCDGIDGLECLGTCIGGGNGEDAG
jgi:putative FmdB family regulatory protein